MIPDFATIRDKTTSKIKKVVYGILGFGWTGSSREWIRYESTGFVLGGIAAVLVVSVHSIVSTDFASSVIPGWHTTLFPPYFVVGAIFSGFAMVMTLMITDKENVQIPGLCDQFSPGCHCPYPGFRLAHHGDGLSYRNFRGLVFRKSNMRLFFCLKAGLPANMHMNSGPCSFATPLFHNCSGRRE